VSLRLLGNQAEDFYAAVGRFVLLTSLLEDRLHLLHSRFGCRQESGADSLYAVIAACSQRLEDVADERFREELRLLLEQSEQARMVRNQLAHYLFPAQDDGTVFGWIEHRGKVKTTDDSVPSAAATLSGEGRMSVHGWIRRVGELSTTVEGIDRAIWRLPPPVLEQPRP
jgi:Probable RNA and SrmB- binding site of polymerase A